MSLLGKIFCLLAVVYGVAATAADRVSTLEGLAARYTAARREYGPPGTYDPAVENLEFARFVLRQPLPTEGGELSVIEWGWVIGRLQSNGFRFSMQTPPFGPAAELSQLVESRTGGNARVLDGVRLHYETELLRTRRTFPVPAAWVQFRPSIPMSQLPSYLSAVPIAENDQIRLSLRQGAGGLSRLTSALELFAQTESGRAVLADLIPMLGSGNLRIGRIDDSVRRRFPESFSGTYQAAALYVPTLSWDSASHSYKIRHEIFVNEDAELGILAEQLFHEAVHATDSRYRSALLRANQLATRATEVRQRNGPGDLALAEGMEGYIRRILSDANADTEHAAFGGQSRFKRELGAHFPEAAAYYYAQLQRGRSHPLETTAEFLDAAYGINGSGSQGNCLRALAVYGR